jgi:hypothetical protein
MRTVLNRICSFIGNVVSWDSIFKSNGDDGEERMIAERQRESVYVRGSALQKWRDGMGHKTSCWKKYMWQNKVGLISEILA